MMFLSCQTGQKLFINLRIYGIEYYNQLPFEDKFTMDYLFPATYGKLLSNKKHIQIIPAFNWKIIEVDNWWIHIYGSLLELPNTPYVLINDQLAKSI